MRKERERSWAVSGVTFVVRRSANSPQSICLLPLRCFAGPAACCRVGAARAARLPRECGACCVMAATSIESAEAQRSASATPPPTGGDGGEGAKPSTPESSAREVRALAQKRGVRDRSGLRGPCPHAHRAASLTTPRAAAGRRQPGLARAVACSLRVRRSRSAHRFTKLLCCKDSVSCPLTRLCALPQAAKAAKAQRKTEERERERAAAEEEQSQREVRGKPEPSDVPTVGRARHARPCSSARPRSRVASRLSRPPTQRRAPLRAARRRHSRAFHLLGFLSVVARRLPADARLTRHPRAGDPAAGAAAQRGARRRVRRAVRRGRGGARPFRCTSRPPARAPAHPHASRAVHARDAAASHVTSPRRSRPFASLCATLSLCADASVLRPASGVPRCLPRGFRALRRVAGRRAGPPGAGR